MDARERRSERGGDASRDEERLTRDRFDFDLGAQDAKPAYQQTQKKRKSTKVKSSAVRDAPAVRQQAAKPAPAQAELSARLPKPSDSAKRASQG